jgi:hypothetical protein
MPKRAQTNKDECSFERFQGLATQFDSEGSTIRRLVVRKSG